MLFSVTFSTMAVTLIWLTLGYANAQDQNNESLSEPYPERPYPDQHDSNFSNSWFNLNTNGTRGLRIIAKYINWYVPHVSDGQSIFKFGIKHSYNRECQSKDDFKRNTFSCLKTHDMFLEDTESSCRIVVTGNQLANTYRQLFRNYSLLDRADAHLLTVNTMSCAKKRISITDFFVFPQSKESTFKFLPYEIDHFRHMLEFDLSLEDPESTKEYVSVDVMNSCLPDISSISEAVADGNITNVNCTEAKLIEIFFNQHQQAKSSGKAQADEPESRLSFLPKQKKGKHQGSAAVEDDGCETSHNGVIMCSAARHLDRSQRHLYMIALYVQVYFIAEYLEHDPYDLEVCLIDKMASRHHQRWFWGRLTASSTSKTERFTLIECCSMTRKLKVYDQPNSDQKMSWVCHDPYRVANIILVCVNVGSYVAVLLFPLCVRFLPPLRVTDSHECCSKHKKKKKRSRWSLRKHKKDPEEGCNDQDPCCENAEETHVCCPNGDNNKGSQNGKPEVITSPISNEGTKAPLLSLPMPTVRITNEEDVASELSEEPCSSLDGNVSRPYVPPHDLLFLDSDPVYSFGLKTILSHVLLFHIENWVLMVVRRFLFLYAMWVFVHFASVIVNFYYPALSVHYQVFYYQIDNRFGYSDKQSGEDFHRMFCILVFVVPLCYAAMHFSLLSPLLLKTEPVSKVLSWDDNESHIGSTIGMESKYLFYKKSKPCEMSFLMLLRSRMKLIVRRQFWKYLFNNVVFNLPKCLSHNPKGSDSSSYPTGCQRMCLLGILYVIKLPLVLFMSIVYTIPFFVFHRELLVKPSKFLPKSLHKSRAMQWAVVLMTITSMVLSFLLFLSFSFLYGSMAIFVLVDIIRNIRTNVNHGVLIVSVLLYVQNALVSLEDEYRYMKRTVFHVCQTLDTEAKENAKNGQLRRRPSLVWTSADGETAIPRRIFTGVCDSLMPYTTEIMQTSLSLLLNLSLVFFLYILVIDFQALDQFTGIGQSLMTIFTVSLPGLIGKLRSSAALQVDSERRYNRVLASVRDVVDTEDVFVVCPSQSKLTAWDCKARTANIADSQDDVPEWV